MLGFVVYCRLNVLDFRYLFEKFIIWCIDGKQKSYAPNVVWAICGRTKRLIMCFMSWSWNRLNASLDCIVSGFRSIFVSLLCWGRVKKIIILYWKLVAIIIHCFSVSDRATFVSSSSPKPTASVLFWWKYKKKGKTMHETAAVESNLNKGAGQQHWCEPQHMKYPFIDHMCFKWIVVVRWLRIHNLQVIILFNSPSFCLVHVFSIMCSRFWMCSECTRTPCNTCFMTYLLLTYTGRDPLSCTRWWK